MSNRIETQDYPLPECIRLALDAGFTDRAEKQIEAYLQDKRTPEVLRKRLELEQGLAKRRREAYPYTEAEAEDLLMNAYEKYRKGMLSDFISGGRVSWAYVDGVVHLESRIVENAARRCPELKNETAGEDPDLKMRDDFIAMVEELGCVRARITAEEVLTVTDTAYTGKEVFINLPLPRRIEGVISDIKVEAYSDNLVGTDNEDAPMRTAQFRGMAEKEARIRFSYTITAAKNKLPDVDKTNSNSEEYLSEEGPHIRFTPYIRALAAEITESCTTPLSKAKAIYFWVTEHVEYSYMREYATIDNISEFAATSLKGDCGVQALLFITLCRVSGVPARWQSGWYVTPAGISCHDWAEFQLGDSWYPADCSFGGGAYRSGNERRHKHYFGSLDIYRMMANSACCKALTGKAAEADDPVDNQRGEAECEGVRIPRSSINSEQKIISFEIVE